LSTKSDSPGSDPSEQRAQGEMAHRVALVDDNASIRDALSMLFRTVGVNVVAFREPATFLEAPLEDFECILLDVRLPEIGGMELFHTLRTRKVLALVIFLTGHGDIPMAVRAMQEGAFDFLEKPVDDQILIESVLGAVRRYAVLREKHEMQAEISSRVDRLTARERQIADLIVAGHTSREIAEQLSLSMRTVEHYRTKIARKLEVDSVTALVKVLSSNPE